MDGLQVLKLVALHGFRKIWHIARLRAINRAVHTFINNQVLIPCWITLHISHSDGRDSTILITPGLAPGPTLMKIHREMSVYRWSVDNLGDYDCDEVIISVIGRNSPFDTPLMHVSLLRSFQRGTLQLMKDVKWIYPFIQIHHLPEGGKWTRIQLRVTSELPKNPRYY